MTTIPFGLSSKSSAPAQAGNGGTCVTPETCAAMAPTRPTRNGRAAPMSRCSSSSTTRKAARTASCMATPPRKPSCRRSSAPQPWPGQRHWNMESIYEYGARAGFWRLHRMFTEASVPVTVYGVATALARSPDQVAAMQEAGWEIASHGLKWIDYRDYAIDDERRDIAEAIRLHAEVTGERPTGWYTGRSSANTVGSPPRKAASPMSPTPMTTTCPTGSTMTGMATTSAAADHSLHARRQRHAFRHAARLQFRRPVLRLSEGCVRHALRGRAAPAGRA